MGTLRQGGRTERIDDVDLMHLERTIAHALALGLAFELVIDDETLAAPARSRIEGRTPMELHYDGLVDEERIDDDRLRIMLTAVVAGGVLHVPRMR